MTLRQDGFRFIVSPDRQRGRWCNPVMWKESADWIDCTDMTDEDFLSFLTSSPAVGYEA